MGRPMFQHWSSPVVSGEAVFVGKHDGFLHKLDASSGERCWSLYLGRLDGAGLVIESDQSVPGEGADPAWESARSFPIFATPAVSRGRVALGTEEGVFYLIEDERETCSHQR